MKVIRSSSKRSLFGIFLLGCVSLILLSMSTISRAKEPKPCVYDVVENCYVFPIHFVVATNQYTPSDADLEREILILNKYFSAEDSTQPFNRRRLMTFKLKSKTNFSTIRNTNSRLIELLTAKLEYDGDAVNAAFNSESDPRIRDRHAINIYIHDSWDAEKEFEHTGGHGRRNNGMPYILWDYARLGVTARSDGTSQAAQEHEMGHAFGLSHICDNNATNNTPTNIMNSGNTYSQEINGKSRNLTCRGNGGLRNIGFDQDQVREIEKRATEIYRTLNTWIP